MVVEFKDALSGVVESATSVDCSEMDGVNVMVGGSVGFAATVVN